MLNYSVYLCITNKGYVHCIFDSYTLALKWCQMHTDYHVITREVYTRLSEVD